MRKTILVTGGNGQLGLCINDLKDSFSEFEFIFTDFEQLDITNSSLVNQLFSNKKIDWCINCAAYTAVDKAESDKENAQNINEIGVENLATACAKNDTKLIHISTDFVFDGKSSKAYLEDDNTNPLSVYGQTKLTGEKAIIKATSKYFIIRTSWLYSEYNHNFLKTMLNLAKTNSDLSIVSDQIGTPTYGKDLAQVILKIINIESNTFGIYHFSNEGVASWYDFAKAIFEITETKVKIQPIKTEDYPTPAERPNFSILDKIKIKETFQINIPYWRDSLITAISNLK